MNTKKLLALLLALAMIFALAGCTSSEPAQPAEPSEPEASVRQRDHHHRYDGPGDHPG